MAMSKSVIGFAQRLFWDEPGHSGNYVFDVTQRFSSVQFFVLLKYVLFLRYLFCIPFILTGGFGMLICHAFAGVLAYMCIAVEITQPSKHKVVICGVGAGLQMSDQ